MRHERHGTGTNIENYISVGLLKVKDVKKGGHGFKKIFIFKYKTHQLLEKQPLIIFTGSFSKVKRKRSNADFDILLLPCFL